MNKFFKDAVKSVRSFFARWNELLTLGGAVAVAAMPRHYNNGVANTLSKFMTFGLVSRAIDRVADGDKMSAEERAKSTKWMAEMVFVLAAYKVAGIIFNANPLIGSVVLLAVTIMSYQMD